LLSIDHLFGNRRFLRRHPNQQSSGYQKENAPVAAACEDAPERELDLINTRPIDDSDDAAVSRPVRTSMSAKGKKRATKNPAQRQKVAGAIVFGGPPIGACSHHGSTLY
jgi:hypothetical protein